MQSPADIQPWRLGVVLETQKTQGGHRLAARARSRTATLVSEREAVEISLDEMKWAAKTARQENRAEGDE